MRCIKPLAPSRNETNSSRVNGGADKTWVIPRICAYGWPVQASHPATIKLQWRLPALLVKFFWSLRAALFWRTRLAVKADDQSGAAPKLDIVAGNQARGFLDGVGVIHTNQRLVPYKMPIDAYSLGAVFSAIAFRHSPGSERGTRMYDRVCALLNISQATREAKRPAPMCFIRAMRIRCRFTPPRFSLVFAAGAEALMV
jgi:hypothetical protein